MTVWWRQITCDK